MHNIDYTKPRFLYNGDIVIVDVQLSECVGEYLADISYALDGAPFVDFQSDAVRTIPYSSLPVA